MKALPSLAVAAALLAAILPLQSAQAAVIYDFQTLTRGSSEPYFASFNYEAPGFIISNTLIPTPDSCLVYTPSLSLCGPTQQFYADSTTLAGSDLYDAVEFSPELGTLYYYYFQNGAFAAYGIYDTVILGTDQAARLVVSASPIEPIPEPASWAMMMVGFAALGIAARRRRSALTVRYA